MEDSYITKTKRKVFILFAVVAAAAAVILLLLAYIFFPGNIQIDSRWNSGKYNLFTVLAIALVLCITGLWCLSLIIIGIKVRRNYRLPVKHISATADRIARGENGLRFDAPENSPAADACSELNDMVNALCSHAKSDSSFITSVAHDLRTPLTTALGYTECILTGVIPEEQTGLYLKQVKSDCEQMKHIIEACTEVSRIQSGDIKTSPEWLDLRRILNECSVDFFDRVNEKGIKLENGFSDTRMLAHIDYECIKRIICNILDNAVRYTPSKGTIRIGAGETGGFYTISIFNSGKGILYEDQSYVFDMFYRADKSRGRDNPGLGLGLYIARALAEAQGGSISVSSQPGKYCELILTLPKNGEPEPQRTEKNEGQSYRRNQRHKHRGESRFRREYGKKLRRSEHYFYG